MSVDEFMAMYDSMMQQSAEQVDTEVITVPVDTTAQQAAYDQALANYNAALAAYEAANQMVETTKEVEVEIIEEVTDEEGNISTVTKTEIQTVTEMVPAGDVVSAQANLDAAKAALDSAGQALETASDQSIQQEVIVEETSEIEPLVQEPVQVIDEDVSVITETTNITTPEVQDKLNSLISQYVGKTSWPSSYGAQCYSFAHFVFNTVFGRTGTVGSYSSGTEYKFNYPASDINTVGQLSYIGSESELEALLEQAAPGDYVQLKRRSSGGPHSLIVVGIDKNNNTIEIFDANTDGNNTVKHYTQTFSTFMQKNQGISIYRYVDYIPKEHDPIGVLDSCGGGAGTFSVYGWAFDPDDTNASIEVHVYIGGPAGDSNAVGYAISTDYNRSDVNNVYGINGNHGYSKTFTTDRRGNQPVYVYAINIGEGTNNPLIGSGTVNITEPDTEGPSITDVKITNISSDGYTISCTVTDNKGLDRVKFPSWTIKNKTDDLLSDWQTNAAANGSVNGSRYTFRVKSSDHNNETGTYSTQIYAWDTSNNMSVVRYNVNVNDPVNLGDSFSAVIRNPKTDKVLTNNNENVVIQTYTNSSDQIWNFKRDSDNGYKITVKSSGKAMDLYKGWDVDETNIITYESQDSENQRWYFYPLDDGSYEIMTKAGFRVVDIYKGDSADGTNVQICVWNTGDNQRFVVEKFIDSFSIKDADYLVSVGGSRQLTTNITPTDAYHESIIWKSSDTSIATVSNGLVKGIKPGNVTITASIKDRNKTFSDEFKVTVSYKDHGTCGDHATWSLDKDGVLTISGYGDMYDYEQSSTSIYAPWRYRTPSVQKVIIEDGITSIGNYAFYGCELINDLNIPSSVTRIGMGAFYLNDVLSSVVLPEGVKTIEIAAFANCASLKSITIPRSVTSIQGNAFLRSKMLTDVYYQGTEDEWYSKKNWWGDDGLYTFGDGITVHFIENAIPFTDVPTDAWYYDVAKDCYETGLINGTSATTFSPMQTMTRAMVVTILWRMEGNPSVSSNNKFKDVSSGQWYANAISWAEKTGVVHGYSDGTFKPDAAVTREQVAVMLANYAGYKKVYEVGTKKLNTYPDGSQVSTWAQQGMKWALTNGIVSGDGAGYLRPKKSATRAEGAAMLLRMKNWL